MKRQALHSVWALALLVGGCPRHSATRLTYVPAPPSPSAKAEPQTASGDTLVIEEPRRPAPAEQAPIAPANPAPVEPAPRRRRPQAPAAEKPPEAPPVPAPALQPLADAQTQKFHRNEVVALQEKLTKRVRNDAYLGDLKPDDRQALEDARGFLAQSLRALQEGDVDRSLKLAKKASLLLDAVEQGR